MKKIGIFFGGTTGKTEAVAETIRTEIGDGTLINVSNADKKIFESYDVLILGTSTWGIGDIQDDWISPLSQLEISNLTNKTVAIFGLGDADAYPDSFVDGMHDIYTAAEKTGAKIIGKTSIKGYDFTHSKAVEDEQFIGLAIDEDNQAEMTNPRIKQWISAIQSDLN